MWFWVTNPFDSNEDLVGIGNTSPGWVDWGRRILLIDKDGLIVWTKKLVDRYFGISGHNDGNVMAVILNCSQE